ncbi:MAG: sigma-70 family RNA polymerase sigma factor, partial [Actinomycetales bacterium]
MSRAPLTTPDLTVEVVSSRRPVQQDLDEAGTSLDAVGTLADLDDLMLLDLARAGSEGAFDELYRRYSYPALRLARHLGPAVEADDVVAETFSQVLDQVRRGRGPQTAFRAYLFTSVRHEVGRRLKQRARVRVTDELEELDGTATLHGGGLEGVEQELVRDALAQLPERWRLVLWRVEVEGLRPREVAEELGIRPNAVSALAYRARGALRQAYLDAHVTRTIDSLPAACRPVRVLLG